MRCLVGKRSDSNAEHPLCVGPAYLRVRLGAQLRLPQQRIQIEPQRIMALAGHGVAPVHQPVLEPLQELQPVVRVAQDGVPAAVCRQVSVQVAVSLQELMDPARDDSPRRIAAPSPVRQVRGMLADLSPEGLGVSDELHSRELFQRALQQGQSGQVHYAVGATSGAHVEQERQLQFLTPGESADRPAAGSV